MNVRGYFEINGKITHLIITRRLWVHSGDFRTCVIGYRRSSSLCGGYGLLFFMIFSLCCIGNYKTDHKCIETNYSLNSLFYIIRYIVKIIQVYWRKNENFSMKDIQLIVQSITCVTRTTCRFLDLHDLFHIIKRYL